MRPRSSSRGRNTSASVTVTVDMRICVGRWEDRCRAQRIVGIRSSYLGD